MGFRRMYNQQKFFCQKKCKLLARVSNPIYLAQVLLHLQRKMSNLFQSLQAVALTKHISFARNRINKSAMARLLPEIADQLNVDLWFLPSQNQERSQDGGVVHAGEKLEPRPESRARANIQCPSSLDGSPLNTQTDMIVCILTALASFGDRVVPLIHADVGARAWFLNEHLLIQARHWAALARRVMSLLRLLGLSDPADGVASCGSCPAWLNQDMVRDAGRRVLTIYGVHEKPCDNGSCEPKSIATEQPAKRRRLR